MAMFPQMQTFALGAPVVVRCSFDGRWVSGFIVSAALDDADGRPVVRVTRVSDSSELPHVFALEDVRPDA